MSLCFLQVVSCKKESPLDEVPKISFVKIYPDTVRAFTDSVVVEISYEDGDGDIGENNAYKQNLFLTDQRNQLVYGFRIGRIVADGTPAIRGTLKIVMPYINLITAPGPESTTFNIQLEDQAGNKSNTIRSSELVITE
ncbi:MAG: hypothetical protein U0Y08_05725 [Bacteroidia bacterium]